MKKLSLIALTLVAGMAQAASDGDLSEDNTQASMDLSASITPVIAIYNVPDANFGEFNPAAVDANFAEKIVLSRSFCVYTNAQGYSIEVDSDFSGDDNFYMVGNAGFDEIRYSVDVFSNDYTGPANGFQKTARSLDIFPGDVVGTIPYYADGYIDNACGTVDGTENNIELRISMDPNFLTQEIAPDDYRDTLRITARAFLGEFGG
ncbi:hypothetical protein BM525_19955 (plasmid) [Alteromonas mediterranea]|uniref:Uncharacterized protein n=1 Tax=Alteromonas mediterranea TaxID=314275 RepID=A0AAC9JHZ6_9ALTE|nr:hypothetical protein [Alteromonas mediterranea]APD92158.1 hypothetical protein BM524_19760 [Alteromonas mediterranea]APE00013.1 hypothetical protein BM525_19955 [Alteromonas mediterranea]